MEYPAPVLGESLGACRVGWWHRVRGAAQMPLGNPSMETAARVIEVV